PGRCFHILVYKQDLDVTCNGDVRMFDCGEPQIYRPFYSFTILFIMILMTLAKARLGRAEILALFAGVALTISVSAPTYLRNALTDGHPFYPLNQIDVISGMEPARFLEQNRWAKFVQ